MASCTFLRVVVDLMLLAVPYSSRSMFMASLICLPGGTYRVISSVWLPSLRASVSSVFRSLNSSRELFFAVLNCFHWLTLLAITYVAANQIKVITLKRLLRL
jgi:hypothetical protein